MTVSEIDFIKISLTAYFLIPTSFDPGYSFLRNVEKLLRNQKKKKMTLVPRIETISDLLKRLDEYESQSNLLSATPFFFFLLQFNFVLIYKILYRFVKNNKLT